MVKLIEISIFENFLTGNLLLLGELPSLQIFDIAFNQFEGSIPSNIFSLRSLHSILAAQNCLSGTIPTEICHIAYFITTIDIGSAGGSSACSSNRKLNSNRPFFISGTFSYLGLSGSIPSCLFTSESINALELSGIINLPLLII